MAKQPHYLSRFHWLVASAEQAGHVVDNCDLTSDPDSRSVYAARLAEACEADLALIDFIVAHHRDLYAAIQSRGSDDDSTEVPDRV